MATIVQPLLLKDRFPISLQTDVKVNPEPINNTADILLGILLLGSIMAACMVKKSINENIKSDNERYKENFLVNADRLKY